MLCLVAIVVGLLLLVAIAAGFGAWLVARDFPEDDISDGF